MTVSQLMKKVASSTSFSTFVTVLHNRPSWPMGKKGGRFSAAVLGPPIGILAGEGPQKWPLFFGAGGLQRRIGRRLCVRDAAKLLLLGWPGLSLVGRCAIFRKVFLRRNRSLFAGLLLHESWNLNSYPSGSGCLLLWKFEI